MNSAKRSSLWSNVGTGVNERRMHDRAQRIVSRLPALVPSQ